MTAPTSIDEVNSHNWTVAATARHYYVDSPDQEVDFDTAIPDEIYESINNVLLNAGITRMLSLLTGAGGQAYDATHCRIGVGDSATAAVATQIDLQATTNRLFNLVQSAPSVSGQTVTFVAVFASGDANFAWAEWCIDAGTTQGSTVTAPALNRKVAAMGTKTSAMVSTLTIAITIS